MEKPSRRIVGLSLIIAVLFGPGLFHLTWLSARQWRLHQRLQTLKARHEQLAAEQIRIESDPAYVEGLIRTTFKVAQPGEYVIPLEGSKTSRSR